MSSRIVRALSVPFVLMMASATALAQVAPVKEPPAPATFTPLEGEWTPSSRGYEGYPGKFRIAGGALKFDDKCSQPLTVIRDETRRDNRWRGQGEETEERPYRDVLVRMASKRGCVERDQFFNFLLGRQSDYCGAFLILYESQKDFDADIRAWGFYTMSGCGNGGAETLKLSGAPDARGAAKAALAYAETQGYSSGDVYDKQVFQVSSGTETLGTLVSGSGMFRESSTCFLALVQPNNRVSLVPTVGNGNWEAEACLSIDAVGLVSTQPKTGFGRLVIIHSGVAGRADTAAAVVVAWNSNVRSFEIDLDASKKAGLAGANTIAKVRKVLQ